jgi:hypothetical protein
MKIIKKGLAKRARQLLLPGIILMLSVSSTRAQQAPISCSGLLNEEQLSQLLKAGVADIRLQAFVSKCGVDFAFNADVENRLRAAGASDAFLTLVRARSAAEQQKKEQEAERLKRVAIEEQKQQEETERLRQAAIEEAVRLTELRRKLGLDPAGGQGLKPNLTLDEARRQLVSLRAQTRDIETRLKAEYPGLEVEPTLTKDMFESTAEYQARQARVVTEHKELEGRYRADLAALTGDYYKKINELLARKYTNPAAKVNSIKYDADQQVLIVTVDDVAYRFSVEPSRARGWYEHQTTLELKENFLKAEDTWQRSGDAITLHDPQTGEELDGLLLAADIRGKWKATVVWKVGNEYLTFNFNQEANPKLSGTFDSSMFGHELSPLTGLINSDSITFTATVNGKPWQFEGRLMGNELKLRRTFSGYSDEFTAERVR